MNSKQKKLKNGFGSKDYFNEFIYKIPHILINNIN